MAKSYSAASRDIPDNNNSNHGDLQPTRREKRATDAEPWRRQQQQQQQQQQEHRNPSQPAAWQRQGPTAVPASGKLTTGQQPRKNNKPAQQQPQKDTQASLAASPKKGATGKVALTATKQQTSKPTTTAKQQPKPTPKPTLKSMSIGDLIPKQDVALLQQSSKNANEKMPSSSPRKVSPHKTTSNNILKKHHHQRMPRPSDFPPLAASSAPRSHSATAATTTAMNHDHNNNTQPPPTTNPAGKTTFTVLKKGDPVPKKTQSSSSSSPPANAAAAPPLQSTKQNQSSKKQKGSAVAPKSGNNSIKRQQDKAKSNSNSNANNKTPTANTTVSPLKTRSQLLSDAFSSPIHAQQHSHQQRELQGGGDEHQLLRLMQARNMVGLKDNKGLQRLRPRIKRFTPLKKKVLEERLRKWKELNPQEASSSSSKEEETLGTDNKLIKTCTVCLFGFAEREELEDEDEYNEILENLDEMARRVGQIRRTFVPNKTYQDRFDEDKVPGFVEFANPRDADAAVDCWRELVLGGQRLDDIRRLFATTSEEQTCLSDSEWQEWCLRQAHSRMGESSTPQICSTTELVLENALNSDDLEDEDCLQESLDDLRNLVTKYGEVHAVRVEQNDVVVMYRGVDEPAQQAALLELNTIVLGGEKLSARIRKTTGQELVTETSLVCIEEFAAPDELEDDEEYEEFLMNLKELAQRQGNVKRVFLPRALPDEPEKHVPAFVEYEDASNAKDSVEAWNGMILGGTPLKVRLLVNRGLSDVKWEEWCLEQTRVQTENSTARRSEVVLMNVLTDDDLEDEDCLQETLRDIREIVSMHGNVLKVSVEREPSPVVVVALQGDNPLAAQTVQELNQIVLGGEKIVARVRDTTKTTEESNDSSGAPVSSIVIDNALTEDDLEDTECLKESMQDLKELAARYGVVQDVFQDPSYGIHSVRIDFMGTPAVATKALLAFNGMVLGGTTLSAKLVNVPQPESKAFDAVSEEPQPQEDPQPKSQNDGKAGQLFSGDKIIPERFAECKRVPKIPNAHTPRHYAIPSGDDTVKPLLIEMLGELMRLQRRAIEEKNTKAKRRLVMGLREVARGIRAHKVKMVVMANNLDEYGVIDDKVQEIIDLAKTEAVPCFFEFTKRSLGKAIGKSLKMAVVGIQSPEGAHQQFKKLSTKAPSW